VAVIMEEIELDLPKASAYLMHDYLDNTHQIFNHLKSNLNWMPSDDGSGRRYYNMGMDYIFADQLSPKGILLEAKPFDSVVLNIMNQLNSRFNVGMNSCHVHYYEDGNIVLPFRNDMEYQIDFDQPIFILSLGASRIWSFKDMESSKEYDFEFKDGDLCILSTNIHERYYHGVKINPDITEPRIGLSFRCFKSFAAVDWYAHE
jgi:hypothetical protein